MTASDVTFLLFGYRFHFSSERQLQDGIAKVLGPTFEREVVLDRHSRPDFFESESGTLVEVKTKGSAADLLRQVRRYAEFPQVKEIAVATTRMLHTSQLPAEINSKPVETVKLWTL